MKHYSVVVSPLSREQIRDYAQHIAEKSGSLDVAERWVDRVYAAIESLNYFPRRFSLAEEDAHRDYAIHRQIIGNYLTLYTIDDESRVVRVIGFRRGNRLPRPDELPDEA